MASIESVLVRFVKSFFVGAIGMVFCVGKHCVALGMAIWLHHESLADFEQALTVPLALMFFDAIQWTVIITLKNRKVQNVLLSLVPAKGHELAAMFAGGEKPAFATV